jgi:hypothetical protein
MASSTVSFAGRNLPPPQSPFVDRQSLNLSYDGYQFLLDLLNIATSALAQQTVSSGLTATGANQATALPLSSQWNEVDVTPAGSGVLLSAYQPGQQQIVFNDDASNALLVYPPPGSIINALAVNAAYSLSASSHAIFYFIKPGEIKA